MGTQCPRGGHNFQCPGASAIIDETTEDRKVCAAVISNFKAAGEKVVDCTPGNCDENTDLKYGTDKDRAAHSNTFIPIHFNKAYTKYVGRIGCEVWLNPKNASSLAKGTRVCNNLAALGFKNRGVKDGVNAEHLHDIKQSAGDAVLVEVCFVEATEDVALYKKLGPAVIGNAIAEGILGRNIVVSPVAPLVPKVPTVTTKQIYRLRKSWSEGGTQLAAFSTITQEAKNLCVANVGYEIYDNVGTQVYPPVAVTKPTIVPTTAVNNSIAQLQAELNKQGAKLLVDGFYGPSTLAACPTLKVGTSGNITKWLQKRLALKVELQDGVFGNITLNAVKAYQVAVHIGADGIVGQGTWHELLR